MRRSLGSIVTSTSSASGMTQHAGARVDAALALGDRHALHPVHAALELQPGPRGLARLGVPAGLDRDAHVLVAAEVGLGGVEHLGAPAAALGVAQVHAQQVAGEQGRLLAALPRLDLEDDVPVVVGVAGDQQPTEPVLGGGERASRAGPPRRRRRPRWRARGRPRRPPGAHPGVVGGHGRRRGRHTAC